MVMMKNNANKMLYPMTDNEDNLEYAEAKIVAEKCDEEIAIKEW